MDRKMKEVVIKEVGDTHALIREKIVDSPDVVGMLWEK